MEKQEIFGKFMVSQHDWILLASFFAAFILWGPAKYIWNRMWPKLTGEKERAEFLRLAEEELKGAKLRLRAIRDNKQEELDEIDSATTEMDLAFELTKRHFVQPTIEDLNKEDFPVKWWVFVIALQSSLRRGDIPSLGLWTIINNFGPEEMKLLRKRAGFPD